MKLIHSTIAFQSISGAEAGEYGAGGRGFTEPEARARRLGPTYGALARLFRSGPREISPRRERIRLLEFLVLRSREKYATTFILAAVTEVAVAGGSRGAESQRTRVTLPTMSPPTSLRASNARAWWWRWCEWVEEVVRVRAVKLVGEGVMR